MLANALRLARTSPGTVFALVAVMTVLANVTFDEAPDPSADDGSEIPSLAPLRRLPVARPARVAAGSAVFDPKRRDETLSGSIDDLRPKSERQVPQTVVEITGVLIGSTVRKAMLAVAGGTPGWIDVNADIGGWHLAAVDQDGAVIERQGDVVTLKIADRYRHRNRRPANDPGESQPQDTQMGASSRPDAPGVSGPASPDSVTPQMQ